MSTKQVVTALLLASALLAPVRAAEEEPPPLPWVAGSTTLAVLPDTEVYSKRYPQYFEAQTKWIAENREARHVAYVLHLGDITQNNVAPQWEVARRSFAMLDGRVPYALATGNHDYVDAASRSTLLNEHFRVADMRKWPTFGGTFQEGRLENSFHLCRIGQSDWVVLALECGPRDAVVAWANEVLAKHPDRLGMLVTHAYLFRDNTRYDHTAGRSQRASPHEWGNDGEELWQKLVRRHRNMRIVLSGHVATDGLGYLASRGEHGNTVHQMLVNYEKSRRGGSAFLRLLEFLPEGKTVQVKAYSPALKTYRTDSENQFTFELEPAE